MVNQNNLIMTTVKELREWLKRFPEDTIVEVGIQEAPSLYQSYGAVNFVSPTLKDSDYGDGWEFSDFRNNQFVKPDSASYGKCFLELGEKV